MKRIGFLLILLAITSYSCLAQKAVLVKLASQKSRIAYFEKKGDQQNANYLRKDAKAIMQATINDFSAHFSFCPVYYFMDTALDRVKVSDLKGVLLNKELKPVTESVLKNGDTSFLIVYYGVPDEVEVGKEDRNTYRSVRYPNNGLVVLDHNYKRPKYTDHFIYKNRPFKQGLKPYIYISKRFELDYKPWAEELQESLKK